MQHAEGDMMAEIAALEAGIRHHVIDLEVAFSTRDWALVARIYRSVAALADRLEVIDPDARSRALERIELEQQAREEAFAGNDDPLLDGLGIAGDDDPPPIMLRIDADDGPFPGDVGRPAGREAGESADGGDPFSPWRLR